MSSPALINDADDNTDTCPSSLSISLETVRSEMEGFLAGFRMKITGKTEVSFSLPETLIRPGFGDVIALRIVAASFTMPRNSVWTSYKCV